MHPRSLHPETLLPPSIAEEQASQPLSASRLIAGGLSLLLVLAIALAAGVPAGQLLATVSGSTHGDVDRAVVPQVVDRQEKRLAEHRPVRAGVHNARRNGFCAHDSKTASVAGNQVGSRLLRESLLALPPPSLAA